MRVAFVHTTWRAFASQVHSPNTHPATFTSSPRAWFPQRPDEQSAMTAAEPPSATELLADRVEVTGASMKTSAAFSAWRIEAAVSPGSTRKRTASADALKEEHKSGLRLSLDTQLMTLPSRHAGVAARELLMTRNTMSAQEPPSASRENTNGSRQTAHEHRQGKWACKKHTQQRYDLPR
jgi:hypothetical protein